MREKSKTKNESAPDIDLIRSLFERKDYVRIAQVVGASGAKLDTIGNDVDAELTMILAFTNFNTKNYDQATKYTELLLDNIEHNNQKLIARDLVENLLIVLIDSHVALGRTFQGYLCCKRAKRFVLNEREEVIKRSKYLSRHMAELIFTRLDFILPILFVLVAIVQIYFSPFNNYVYVLIGLVMLGLIYSLLRNKAQMKDILNRFFEKLL